MTVRNHNLPSALPCGGDPLDRGCVGYHTRKRQRTRKSAEMQAASITPHVDTACGAEPAHPKAQQSCGDEGQNTVKSARPLDLCLACLPRPQGLVKLECK